MKNNKFLIGILTIIFILCGCGPSEIERKITSSSTSTTVTVATAVTELVPTSSCKEVSTSSISVNQMTTNKKERQTSTSKTLPEEFIPFQTQKVIETSTTQQGQNCEEQEVIEDFPVIIEEEEYIVFKPSTHYIHKSSCHWVTAECIRIEDTKDIKARKCNECNPEMEIQNEYKEKKKKTSPSDWTGPVLTPSAGTIMGPSGKETYYNLDMSGVVSIMRDLGYTAEKYPYWIRDDGCKMLGDYIIVAADLNTRPRGTIIQTSLGMGIVCDTGGFVYSNATQLDIATTW